MDSTAVSPLLRIWFLDAFFKLILINMHRSWEENDIFQIILYKYEIWYNSIVLSVREIVYMGYLWSDWMLEPDASCKDFIMLNLGKNSLICMWNVAIRLMWLKVGGCSWMIENAQSHSKFFIIVFCANNNNNNNTTTKWIIEQI